MQDARAYLRVRVSIVPGMIRLDAGVTRLDAGTFLRRAPNATREGDTTFFYSDVTYSFGSQPPAVGGTGRP